MKISLDPANPQTWPKGRVNATRLDALTESQLAAQQARDDSAAMQDEGKFAGRVRQRLSIWR